MNVKKLPFHVFLSYSSSDSKYVANIEEKLVKANIPLWIDTENLMAGTPDWERTVRDAISHAFVMVFLCSPSSKDSIYVQAELALAKNYDIPVIPLWIEGETWIDSTPLSMVQVQYIDFKKNSFDVAMDILIKTLHTTIAKRKPKHFVVEDAFNTTSHLNLSSYLSIWLDDLPCIQGKEEYITKEKMVVFNPDAYSSLQELLDDLYIHYLKQKVSIATYGKEWILKEFDEYEYALSVRLILPLAWLKESDPQIVHKCHPFWTSSPLSKYGLIKGSCFTVVSPHKKDIYRNKTPKESAYGIAISNLLLFEEICHGNEKEPIPLYIGGYLNSKTLDKNHNYENSKYTAVFMEVYSLNIDSFKEKILVETKRKFHGNKYHSNSHHICSTFGKIKFYFNRLLAKL
ncbi:MAG: toll/interleukin-1 receptor domain-containing protein [Epsilonproteobacteria bacterium]|nr:toll/interleukin-1 receptor domain-containing protein [Campylobacterota bacterium]